MGKRLLQRERLCPATPQFLQKFYRLPASTELSITRIPYRLSLTGGEVVKIGDKVPKMFVVYKKDIWITSEGRLYYASGENDLLQEVLTNGAENISVLNQGATIYTTK